MNRTPTSQQGVTLIEFTLVLVVFGLLLGGILKTTELLDNAKVKSLADRNHSIRFAWTAFIDRYGAVPGTISNIRDYLPDGQVSTQGGYSDNNQVRPRISKFAFQNLAVAGLLQCGNCTGGGNNDANSLANSPANTYGGFYEISWGGDTGIRKIAHPRTYDNNNSVDDYYYQNILYTGKGIASNLLAELDRKIDDGTPNKGWVRFGGQQGEADNYAVCTTATSNSLDIPANMRWRPVPVARDCGAGSFL